MWLGQGKFTITLFSSSITQYLQHVLIVFHQFDAFVINYLNKNSKMRRR